MPESQMFTIDGALAKPARHVTMTEAGLLERQHLQEWVIAHPQMLGEDLLLVTFEFDRWVTAAGTQTWERLDVLALDREGRLVVAELKRDRAPDSVLVQALNYAAMVSRFNVDLLAEAYLAQHGPTAEGDPLAPLQEWAPTLSDETLAPPRIVLVAEDFGPVLTNTAMFLIEQGLDLRLMRAQLYDIGGTLALTTTQVLPVPEAADFMVRPRSAATTQRATREAASRRASIPERLIGANALAPGDPLKLVPPAGVGEDRPAVEAWLDADPARSSARWRDDVQQPIEWEVDGAAWNPTTLVRHVVALATGEPARTSVWGVRWFVTAEGLTLDKVAELVDPPKGSRFDWTKLHDVLSSVPAGRWTTYGDLAVAVGTAAQPLGLHIAHCAECPTKWRVLGAGGKPRSGFAWSDPTDKRTQADVLAAEGVAMTNGAADPSQRITGAELERLS